MTADDYLALIEGERRGLAAGALRAGLSALALAYRVGLEAYLLPYGLGVRRRARLPVPVVCVGNLTSGGTGKTPMTQLVCETLQAAGIRPAVLSRGYRGEHEHGAAVVATPERIEMSAAQAGDEAHLLASLLPGVPVLAGKDRRVTGRLACERFAPGAVVLDDGMQFYQLHRDLDIVLIDARRPFHNGWTLPRGLLREPPSHLRRAGLVVMTHADRIAPKERDALACRLQSLAPRAAHVRAWYRAAGLRSLAGPRALQPAEWLAGRRVATFCALASPQGFEEQVLREGAQIVHAERLPDHATATLRDLERLIEIACAGGAEAVVVSEKDAAKLPPLGRPIPFLSLAVRHVVDKPDTFRDVLLRALRQ